MNIRSAAYDLCKSILKSDARDEIKRMISGILTDKKGGEQLGYIARQEGMQLLSYLIYNERRDVLEEISHAGAIPSLDESTLRVFEQTHKQLQVLNHQCLLPLTNVIPQCIKAIDP